MHPIRLIPKNVNSLILPFMGNGQRNLIYDSALGLSSEDSHEDTVVTYTFLERDIPLHHANKNRKEISISKLSSAVTPDMTAADTKFVIIGADHHVVPLRLATVDSTNGRRNQIVLDSTNGFGNPLHHESILVHHHLGFGIIQGMWGCYANNVALLVGFRRAMHDTNVHRWVLLWVPRENVFLGMKEIMAYEFQKSTNDGQFERGLITKVDAGCQWVYFNLEEGREQSHVSRRVTQVWMDFICE